MYNKSAVTLGTFQVPVYTAGQSRVRSRINLGLDLTDYDYVILANDVHKTCNSTDLNDKAVKIYLDKKYPEWIYLDQDKLAKSLLSSNTI